MLKKIIVVAGLSASLMASAAWAGELGATAGAKSASERAACQERCGGDPKIIRRHKRCDQYVMDTNNNDWEHCVKSEIEQYEITVACQKRAGCYDE
jgi:hypothetical protein